jgi:glycerol-3-phosphate acyltransferase PlsY
MLDGALRPLVFGVAVAYLTGAIPVGFFVARAFGIGDIRRHGSGNIGMTNVLRTAGKTPAVLTLIGDVAKGMLAVWLAAYAAGVAVADVPASAVAAVIGNCWSVFLRFRGGKGVATGLGALLMLVPWAIGPSAMVFLVVVLTTRYVSLGSLLGALGVPVVALVLGYPLGSVIAAALVALIIVGRHHQNIARLWSGTENRLGRRMTAA